MPLPAVSVIRESRAFRVGASVSLATGLYGLSFGALGVAAGLTTAQTMALSLLMFTGGSQFAYVGTIAAGGSGASATLAASLLGVRNAIYGVSMNALIRPRGWRRPLAAQVSIDESAAVASSQTNPRERHIGFWTAGLGVFLLWNLFTALGAVLGAAMGDTSAWGLDGAAVAAFLGLLWARLRDRESVAIAVVCGLVTALLVPMLPAGVPIIVAAVVAIAWALLGERRDGPGEC